MNQVMFKRKSTKSGGYWGTILDETGKCRLTMSAKGKRSSYTKEEVENLFRDLIRCIDSKSYAWKDE